MSSILGAFKFLGTAWSFVSKPWREWRGSLSIERGLHEEQLDAMRRKRALEDSVEYRPPFFFKKGDDNPGCPTCWQKDRNFVYLKPEERSGDGERTYRLCPVCLLPVHTGALHAPRGPSGGMTFSR
jgi:hypothetical protein